MERLRIIVRRVREHGPTRSCIAVVSAVSHERMARRPRARIVLQIALDPRRPGESSRALRRRAREEALRFLDVE